MQRAVEISEAEFNSILASATCIHGPDNAPFKNFAAYEYGRKPIQKGRYKVNGEVLRVYGITRRKYNDDELIELLQLFWPATREERLAEAKARHLEVEPTLVFSG